MAYGTILNQNVASGLGAKLCIAYFDSTQTSSLTNVTVTGQTTGQTYGATYNSTLNCFVAWVNVYDTYTVSGMLNGETYTTTVVVDTSEKINIFFVSTTLNDNSWDVIRYAADNSLGANYWAVGDAKQITINGTIGKQPYNNYQPWVYILGFNHNVELEGNNMIHFGCFRSDQVYNTTNGIALNDSSYGAYVSTIAFNMNSTGTNAGGWESSRMRTAIINANADLPTSASTKSFLAALPSDLQSVLKQCTKYTDNVGNGTGNLLSNVTPTQDWAFLLSEYEVFGNRYIANTIEQVFQQQYQYYANGNSKIKYKQTSESAVLLWYLRSDAPGGNNSFCSVNNNGTSQILTANSSYGCAPAFCV